MNLIDLMTADGHKPRRVATTGGGEWASGCPFCGGTDRFRIWPARGTGAYWCRQCGESGSAVGYLIKARGIPLAEALRLLGITPGLPKMQSRRGRPCFSQPTFTPRKGMAPSAQWQKCAQSVVEASERFLWSDRGSPALAFLRDRGLQVETIRSARLGWIPGEMFERREAWGLAPKAGDDGKSKWVWLPRGVLIPSVRAGNILRLRIRRPDPTADPRYPVVSGSNMSPMIMGNTDADACLILESELDAILCSQLAGDLCAVVALGSVTIRPDSETDKLLWNASTILNSLDYDAAGAAQAWKWWPSVYGSRVKRWPVPVGKDPGEAQTLGINLRTWILTGLGRHEEKPIPQTHKEEIPEDVAERLAIMTDGGLSEKEALVALKFESGG